MTLLSESRDALHSLLLNCRDGIRVTDKQEGEVMALIMRLDEAADIANDEEKNLIYQYEQMIDHHTPEIPNDRR